MGLRQGTTREQVLSALEDFGRNDDMYALGEVYEIKPYEGWTIRPGCLHAPGPWPTFEIQLPQDDFNFAAWRLGARLEDGERTELWETLGARGLLDATDFLNQVVDLEMSLDPDFKAKYHRPAQQIESGPWGRRLRIFFDEFYGEAIEVEPGQRYTRVATDQPFAGIIWSGEGTLNAQKMAARPFGMNGPGGDMREFLVTPGHQAMFEATGDVVMRVYTVFPFTKSK